jgi:hypothetical protein
MLSTKYTRLKSSHVKNICVISGPPFLLSMLVFHFPDGKLKIEDDRVTRLGEFSPSGQLATLGSI